MKKTNLRWIVSLLIIVVLTGCGKKSSEGNAESKVAEEEVMDISPRQVIDNFIDEMIEIQKIISSRDINRAKKRFDRACSDALKHFDNMSDEKLAEAYEYWAEVTKNPQIRNLDSFGVDTPTGQKFAERINEMHIKNDKNINLLIGKTIKFTDKAGARFTLHIQESEPDVPQHEGTCMLYSIEKNKSFPGTWDFQSKDLGMSSLYVKVPEANSDFWEQKERGVNFGEAHHYHNSNHVFFPASSSGEFYIVKGKIWPYFISTDGFAGYEQFALSYTSIDK